MVVLALVYVALLLVDQMFPPGRVHRRAVRPIVRTLTNPTTGDCPSHRGPVHRAPADASSVGTVRRVSEVGEAHHGPPDGQDGAA